MGHDIEDIALLEIEVIAIILIAIAVAVVARRLRLPYTIAMVLTGLGVSFFTGGGEQVLIQLEPELILLTFLPGLLFESAYHLELKELRANMGAILLFAIPGVLLSMFIIGFLLNRFLGLGLTEALLFGVLISATDPIAVVALFKELGVEKRLSLLVEGESLFNDGVSVVVYGILLGAVSGDTAFSFNVALVDFLVTILGGALLGWSVGALISIFMGRNEDHLVDIALTAVASYGTYLLAEVLLGGVFSPVIAVVIAGVSIGNYGARVRSSATTEITITSFWEFIAFLLNSFIFLLIGAAIDPASLFTNAQPILIAIGVILAARASVVYVLGFISNQLGQNISAQWAHVLVWGGLRGAVSIALALSLPFGIASRDLLTVMTFGYVLFSLVVQGLTIRPLLRFMGMFGLKENQRQFEIERGKMAIAQAGMRAIKEMEAQELVPHSFAKQISALFHTRTHEHWENILEIVREDQTLAYSNMSYVQRELASRQKAALMRLVRNGMLSEEIYGELAKEIDTMLAEDRLLPLPAEENDYEVLTRTHMK